MIVNSAPVHLSYEISDTWKQLIIDQTYQPTIPGRSIREFTNEGAFAALHLDGSVSAWGHSYFGGDD